MYKFLDLGELLELPQILEGYVPVFHASIVFPHDLKEHSGAKFAKGTCFQAYGAEMAGPWIYTYTPPEVKQRYLKTAKFEENVWRTQAKYKEFGSNFKIGLWKPCFTACEDNALPCIPKSRLPVTTTKGQWSTQSRESDACSGKKSTCQERG